MIQVRFDQQSPSRLGLVWREPEHDAQYESGPETDARAANLLFSILRQDSPVTSEQQAQPAAIDPVVRRRAKPRGEMGLRMLMQPGDAAVSIDPIKA